MAPVPGYDDEEEENYPSDSSEPINWASKASMKPGDKWTTVAPKKAKVGTPKADKQPPARGPKAPASTPPHKRELRLIAVRAREHKKEPIKRALICNTINRHLIKAGVVEKSGQIALATISRTNNIVLEVDGNHNSTTMLPYLDLVAKGLRESVGYPIEKITRDLERTFLHVQGIPLNHHHPRAGVHSWEASDWDIKALESAKVEFGKMNAGINSLDRPRLVGNFANLKAKKATTASFVFGVEKNEAAAAILKAGRSNFGGTTKTTVEWFPATFRTFCERCLNTHHLRGMCPNPPVCKYCWGRHESPKHTCPIVGCNVIGECIKHVNRKCINCDSYDHYAGADNCPARGDPKGFNPDNPRHTVQDPTTRGHRTQPRLHHPDRRGQKAIDQKPAAQAADTSDTEADNYRRPSQRKRNLKTKTVTRTGSPTPKKVTVQVPETPNRRAARETLATEKIGIVDLVNVTIPDSQSESTGGSASANIRPKTPETTTHPAPKTPSSNRIMREADTNEPTQAPLSDEEFDDMIEEEIAALGEKLGEWVGQNHHEDHHWSHRHNWCLHKRKKQFRQGCLLAGLVHPTHFLAGKNCECRKTDDTSSNPCPNYQPPVSFATELATTKLANELADTEIPATQTHHWTHQNNWCSCDKSEEEIMNAPCIMIFKIDSSHYRTRLLGCNPATEDSKEVCPVFKILMADMEENRSDFERSILNTITEHHPNTTVEVTLSGRVIINGEDTPSQYLNRSDGTGIHPNCHCRISYIENKEIGECTTDCPCYHRSPVIAFILIENNVVTRIPANDTARIEEARQRQKQNTAGR